MRGSSLSAGNGAGGPLQLERSRTAIEAATGKAPTFFRLVVVIGHPLPGNRSDCKAWEESVGKITTIADGGYPSTGPVVPHRRRKGEDLPGWKEAHNTSHRQVRARVEHVFARMKTWKILRDSPLKGNGVHHAMNGIARFHNLALTG